eukprot:c22356_g1_i2 orf=379-723(+)
MGRGHSMWSSCMKLKGMEDAMQTLQPLISKSRQCFFHHEVVARRKSVTRTLKPDVIRKLKGSRVVEHASVGAFLSLHSGGDTSYFDDDLSVGQLITYGQEFLNRSPERLQLFWV